MLPRHGVLLFIPCLTQTNSDNILQADRWNTSALGEVFSSLVPATCGTERKRVCQKDIARIGRGLYS